MSSRELDQLGDAPERVERSLGCGVDGAAELGRAHPEASALEQPAPDAPLESRPYGGTITVKYPYNTISYKYDRKTNTYLRTVTGEKKQTDAQNDTRAAANVAKDLEASRAERCKKARAIYTTSINSQRLYRQTPDGKREYLTDAELAQQRLDAAKSVDAICGPQG